MVVQSDNKTQSLRFIDALDSAVRNDSSVKNVTGTTSIYDLQRQTLVNMTPDLYSGLYEGYDNITDASQGFSNATDTIRNSSDGLYYLKDNITKINSQLYSSRRQIISTSQQLYSARDQLVAAHDGMYQIKDAADMILGVPSNFVNAYNGIDPSLDDANRSAQASHAVSSSLSGTALAYFNAFYAHWISDADHSNPSARAERAIQSSQVSSFIGNMPASQQQLMYAIVQNYPLSNYGDAATREFAVSTAGQSISDADDEAAALHDLRPRPDCPGHRLR